MLPLRLLVLQEVLLQVGLHGGDGVVVAVVTRAVRSVRSLVLGHLLPDQLHLRLPFVVLLLRCALLRHELLAMGVGAAGLASDASVGLQVR